MHAHALLTRTEVTACSVRFATAPRLRCPLTVGSVSLAFCSTGMVWVYKTCRALLHLRAGWHLWDWCRRHTFGLTLQMEWCICCDHRCTHGCRAGMQVAGGTCRCRGPACMWRWASRQTALIFLRTMCAVCAQPSSRPRCHAQRIGVLHEHAVCLQDDERECMLLLAVLPL